MSRSGYTYYCDDYLAAGRWRGRLMSAMRGKRGQKLLRELRDALDAMPEKALIAHELVTPEGDCCALGCLAKAKGIDVSAIDPKDRERVAATFDIAEPLACEIVYENDECGEKYVDSDDGRRRRVDETPEERWTRMRNWVESKIKQPA